MLADIGVTGYLFGYPVTPTPPSYQSKNTNERVFANWLVSTPNYAGTVPDGIVPILVQTWQNAAQRERYTLLRVDIQMGRVSNDESNCWDCEP